MIRPDKRTPMEISADEARLMASARLAEYARQAVAAAMADALVAYRIESDRRPW